MFSKEVFEKFSKLGKEKEYQDIKKIYTDHQQRFIKEIRPLPRRPKRLFGQNGLNYIQMALWRSKTLIDGILTSIEKDNPLIGALSTRAHFEVTGSVAYLLKKLNNFYAGKIKHEQLDEALFRLTVGTRDSKLLEDKKAPHPVNVLNMIEAADGLFRKHMKDDTKIFRGSYDWLSEFCHPNNFGLQFTRVHKDGGIIEYLNSSIPLEEHQSYLTYFMITAPSFILFYDDTFELLKKNEELPIIIRKKQR